MLTLDQLRDAVDPYTGALRFAVPIASLPGVTGSDWPLALLYDSGTVDETVAGWNLSDPTGVAGLGWTLPLDRIEVDRGDQLGGDQVLSVSQYTLVLAGRRYRLVPVAGAAPGTQAFATQPYEFWRLLYTPADESWTVTLDDGSVLIFGGIATGRGTVDLGYAWGNWCGATLQTAGRRLAPVGWSLAQRTDVWGNAFVFGYDQTQAQLGTAAPAAYTRDSRLSRIDGPDGSALVLHYAAKQPVEYTDPYSGVSAAAWQSRFGAMALASVDELAPGGTVLATTTLDYLGPGGMLAAIGTGDHTKRLLTGLTRQASGAYELPALSLGYDTDPTSPSYGALTSIITVAGGEMAISYARPQPALAGRDIVLAAPSAGDAEPRVFFGTDYAVALWRATDGSVHAVGYRWQGRWLPAPLIAPAAADDAAYQALAVACGQDCFAIVGATQYTLYHADSALPGGWIGSTAPEPLGLPAGEPVALAAGAGYVALAAGHSGTMTVRWFDGAAWQSLACAAPAGTVQAALSGSTGSLVRVASSGARDHQILLAAPARSGAGWSTSTFTLSESVPALDTVAVAAGAGHAVVTLAGWAGASRAVSYAALWWNPAFSDLSTAMLSRFVGPPPPAGIAVPQVAGACALIGQDAYRFDGAAWQHQDLSTLAHPGQGAVTALSLGPDAVARAVRLTTGALLYDLIVYNPADTTGTPWGYPAGMSALPARTGATTAAAALFDPAQPGAASRFVLLNNTLYLRGGDGSWSSVLVVQDVFDATTIASLLLADSSYLAYQTGTGVSAYPLTGGGLGASSGVMLAGAKLLPTAGAPLAGQNAFVAYTGTWGDPAAVLTLHRAVAEDVRGPLTPLTVSGVVLYASGGLASGGPLPYGAIPIAYDFGPASATASDDGRALAANHVTVTEAGTADQPQLFGSVHTYLFNRLTAAETPQLPYPTGPATNAAANLGPLAGTPYTIRTLSQSGAAVLADTMWWWVSRDASGGAYQRVRQESTATDGVPSQRTLSYHPDTGMLAELDATLADGTQLRTTYKYWWEAYDPARAMNLLTPVIQCMQYAGAALVRGSATTWTGQWAAGPGRWAPRGTYTATSATAADFTGWTGDPPPPPGWQLTQQIAGRTAAGLVSLTRDALGRAAASLYSADGTLQLASFANADVAGQEAYHYNCEPYEDPGPWSYLGGTLESHLVERESNLGTRCLQVAPDPTGATGPVAAWTPAGQNRSYLFSCWAQTGAALVEGDAAFVLSARAGSRQLGTVTVPLPNTAGLWSYVSAIVPLGAWRAAGNVPAGTLATITALGANTKTGLDVFLDGLRFQPCDADYHAEVPDPATGLSLGSLQANGITYRQLRDANRIVTATVGPDPATARLTIPAFARLATADGSYAAAFPNTVLEAEAGSAADYQNFEASDAGLWTLPSGWTIGGGTLAYTGSQPGIPGSAAVLTAFSSPNYAAHVRFLPPQTDPVPDVGIGCGNVIAFHLAASDAWVLATTADGQHWTQGAQYPGPLGRGDLVFALLDGRVTVFAAGRQVFSEAVPSGITPDGGLRLCLTGPGAFSDLVALSDPQLRLALIDGRGLAQQSVDLRATNQVDALGTVTDQLGQPAYDKNAAAVPLALSGYRIAGDATSYLPPVGGEDNPTLDQYLQYGNGSPFIRAVPEPAPSARLSQLGLPGDELAVGGGHSTAVAYAQNTATGPMAGLVPDAQAGNYELVGVTDPDQNPNYRLVSSSGTLVAQRTALTAPAVLTQGFASDPTGRLAAVTPPNGYAQSDQAAWQTVYTRDFLGRIVAIDSPDEQHSQTAYDSVGRPRFTQSAADAAATPAQFGYRTYDGIDRVVEEGVITGATWTAALAQVDNSAWPDATVTHTVTKTMSYDAPAATGASLTEGRLAQLSVYGTDGTLSTSESYDYDTAGRVTAQRLQAPAYSTDTWITGYTYDSRGNVTQVDYPRAQTDGSAPLTVAYAYDRDGRITAVGEPAPGGFADPLNPPPDLSGRYGRFQYAADGSLASSSYQNDDPDNAPIPVDYNYSPAGWPLSTTSPVYSEQIGYTSGGYGGAGSYVGLPASAHRQWQAEATALYPLRDYTAQYAYDQAGRLTAAAPYLAPNTTTTQNPPLTLDANSNLLTVARGDAVATYTYPQAQTAHARSAQAAEPRAANTPVQPSDRLQDVAVTLASSCTFDATPPPGWSWGASDGGPGGPAVVDGGPTGNKCLSIPGAALGMAGVLTYRGYMDPRGTYTLQYQLKAGPEFAAQTGPAGWYLVLHGPDGPIATVLAAAITSPPTAWAQQTVTFNLAGVYQVQGAYAQVVDVSFALRNHRGGPDGTLGAALQVDDLVLTGGGDLGAIEYDASGKVTALTGAGLTAMTYAPDSNTLAVFRTAAVGGYTMDFALGETGEYATRQAAPADPNGVPGATLYLRTPDGRLLEQMNRWGGVVTRTLYIEGPNGVFAVQDGGGQMSYLIRSAGSSTGAVTDIHGNLTQLYDTDAFGQVCASVPGGPDVLGRLGPFDTLRQTPPAPYAPWLGRTLTPVPRLCPPAKAANAAADAGPGIFLTLIDLLPGFLRTPVNFAYLSLVDGTEAMGHNPDAWYVYGLAASAFVIAADHLGAPYRAPLNAAALASAFIGPYAEGTLRFLHARRQTGRCEERGVRRIFTLALIEDVYHGVVFGPLEAVPGSKTLRPRGVEPIPDGFYMFIVTEWFEFRYRDIYDRTGGNELYIRHSQLAGGGCVWAAGMMALFGDEIVLTNQSGHYGPPTELLEQYAVPLLRAAGYDQYRITVCSYDQIDLKRKMIEFRKSTGRA